MHSESAPPEPALSPLLFTAFGRYVTGCILERREVQHIWERPEPPIRMSDEVTPLGEVRAPMLVQPELLLPLFNPIIVFAVVSDPRITRMRQ